MLLCWGGYLGYPPTTIQTWSGGTPSRPGWRGPQVPPTIQTWSDHPDLVGGYPPTIQTWSRGDPSRPGQGGTPGTPHHPDLVKGDLGWGTPDLRWGTSLLDLGWGTPLPRPGMGYPLPDLGWGTPLPRPGMGYPPYLT